MKKIFLWFLLSIGFTANVFGQAPLSLAVTRDQLLEKIVRAEIGISGATMQNNGVGFNITDTTADGITRAINGTHLTLKVLNPKETIFFYARLSDEEGNTLFYGYNLFELEQTSNGWKLPNNYNNIELKVVDYLPIHIEGAVGVGVMAFDEEGNVVAADYPNVWNGTFYLNTGWLRENAFLSVYVGEEWVYYDLSNGKQRQATEFNAVALTSIKGIKSQSVGNVYQEIITENRIGESMIIEYKPLVSQKLLVYFWTVEKGTTDYGWPKGVWVRRAHGERVYYPILIQNMMSPHIEVLINRSETIYFTPDWSPDNFIDKDAKEIPVDGPKG